MKDNYTHITIVMDRTGSMQSVRTDAEGAVNYFLTEQKKVDDPCTLLFIDFDSEAPSNVVYDGDLSGAPHYTLEPRASTPLLDAVGRTIIKTGKRLEDMAEADRPGKVIFVIQTDGQENASREFTWEQVAALIKEQTETYNWEFVFLGMGLDTFKQGQALGIRNVVQAANTGISNAHTHSVMSAYATDYRKGYTHDMSRAGGMTVNSVGKVYDADGDEIDPATGKKVTEIRASS